MQQGDRQWRVVDPRAEEELGQRDGEHDAGQRPGEQQEQLVVVAATEDEPGDGVSRRHTDEEGHDEGEDPHHDRVDQARQDTSRVQEGAHGLGRERRGREPQGKLVERRPGRERGQRDQVDRHDHERRDREAGGLDEGPATAQGAQRRLVHRRRRVGASGLGHHRLPALLSRSVLR